MENTEAENYNYDEAQDAIHIDVEQNVSVEDQDQFKSSGQTTRIGKHSHNIREGTNNSRTVPMSQQDTVPVGALHTE